MQISLPATLEAVEGFFVKFRRCARAALSQRHCFTAELLAREALNNAVVHGCRADPNKQVHCSVRLKGGRLLIVVHDDGEGFDWRATWGNRSEASVPSGRGIELLRMYATRIRFNERGNAVTIVKRCR
jgi:anti-sigma regulatory factor (Ser/Thr protein kinase)